jgi:integrase
MVARCLRFLVLTATRNGEARGARWSEIDMDAAVWTIAPARMKAGTEHRVPLSDAAADILRELAALRTGDLVFEGHTRGRPLRDTTLTETLRRLGYNACSVHGMRSCFRDWCADRGEPSDLAEMCLAHTVGNAVERSYRRSDVLERRRLLMQRWANFLLPRQAAIIPLRASA